MRLATTMSPVFRVTSLISHILIDCTTRSSSRKAESISSSPTPAYGNSHHWRELLNPILTKYSTSTLKAYYSPYKKALPLFQKSGSIILMASAGGSKGIEGLSVYDATKAPVRSFARSWTVDLKNHNLRVNAINPGPIDTLAVRFSFSATPAGEQLKNKLLSNVPLGRMGNPDEVAKAVSFLASDDSSYITGIELFVDGGIAQI